MIKNKVKYLEHNNKGNDYIIGDLHGCYDLFRKGLYDIGFMEKHDRIISVGDLIDRGPKSWECLHLIKEPWFESVIGNHEQMMIEELLDETHGNWKYNGGGWNKDAIDEYGLEAVRNAAKLLLELPYVIVLGKETDNRINVVHAEFYKRNSEGMPDDTDIDMWNFNELNEDNLIWGRNIIQLEQVWKRYKKINPGLSPTYVGHTPVKHYKSFMNHNYIDTGAVYGGGLTFFRVKDQKKFLIKE